VTTHHTGKRGRPKKIVDPTYLQEALAPDRSISKIGLSKTLGIHRHTLGRSMSDAGISQSYTDLSNDNLDELLKVFKLQKPESGFRYALGFLRNHGIRIQQQRVLQSLRRVDPIGRILRERRTIRRREYHVARPNSLWHCDGHHKLIAWGIVIHGIIDGYCRTVTIFFLLVLVQN
jgi:hypothetical protein